MGNVGPETVKGEEQAVFETFSQGPERQEPSRPESRGLYSGAPSEETGLSVSVQHRWIQAVFCFGLNRILLFLLP
jgi:hypothetical protein